MYKVNCKLLNQEKKENEETYFKQIKSKSFQLKRTLLCLLVRLNNINDS